MSGSVTISNNRVPARLRSTRLPPAPPSQTVFACVRGWAWTSSPIASSYGMLNPGFLLLHRGQPLALTPHCFTACLKRFCQDGLVVGYEFAALIHRLVQGLAGLSGQLAEILFGPLGIPPHLLTRLLARLGRQQQRRNSPHCRAAQKCQPHSPQ